MLLDDYNQLKIINIDPTRNIYFNKEYNTTIIELKAYDNINNYLELDDNLFGNNIKSIFENESLYILHYLNSAKAIVSYGILNKLNEYNINHSSFINVGSIGAPILNLVNNKVIGISLEAQGMSSVNGVILKFPIEDFINKYQINNNQMPNVFNNNFGMGINNNFIPNINNMNNNNLMPGMINNFNFMPNLMMNNNSILKEQEEWLKGFSLGVEEVNNNDEDIYKPGPKMNVIFNTTKGTTTIILCNYGTTIDKTLERYLKRIGRLDLYENKSNQICFLFSGLRLRYGDQTPIEEFFKGAPNPKVVVNDVNSMFGG